MKLFIQIVHGDGKTEGCPLQIDIPERIILAHSLKETLRTGHRMNIPQTGSFFMKIKDSNEICISDDEYIFDEAGLIHLMLVTSRAPLHYVLIYPDGVRKASKTSAAQRGLTPAQLTEIIRVSEKLEVLDLDIRSVSFKDNFSDSIPSDYLLFPDSDPVFILLTNTLTRLLEDTRTEFKAYVTHLLSERDWSVMTNEPDSMQSPAGFLRVSRPRFKNISSIEHEWPLWSDEIMNDIRNICKVTLPVDTIRRWSRTSMSIVMVGVSGCGKSRTCYDFCRSQFSIYMDWKNHLDLKLFIASLPPLDSCYRGNSELMLLYTDKVRVYTMRIFVVRLSILRSQLTVNPNYTPDEFFQFQAWFRDSDFGLMKSVMRLPDSSVVEVFNELKQWAQRNNVRYVMDESHVLMEVLNGSFHSTRNGAVGSDGLFLSPRSFMSFLVNFLRFSGMPSVWAGTHLFNSARRIPFDAGTDAILFTEFNFISASMIVELLDKWVVCSDAVLKRRIAQELQGRPRLLMQFLVALGEFDGVVDDSHFAQIYHDTYGRLMSEFTELWKRASRLSIREFDGRSEEEHGVLSLLEDLIYNDCLTDITRLEHAHWYRSLVSTSLVMLSKLRNQEGLMCEPIVLRSGKLFGIRFLKRDLPFNTILNRDMVMKADAATRGKGVEACCVARLRGGFWLQREFRSYFPQALVEILDRGEGPSLPLGIHDCRSGVIDHAQKLCDTFLNSGTTHVVLPQERSGGADVVYSYFSFHIKTKWIDSRGKPLVISQGISNANGETIETTIAHDETMKGRTKTNPWVRVRFEFPTNSEMKRLKKNEIVKREPLRTTITASIDSRFTRLFFGEAFVAQVKHLTSYTV